MTRSNLITSGILKTLASLFLGTACRLSLVLTIPRPCKVVTKLYDGANVDADAKNGLVISAGKTSVPKVAKKK